VRATLDRWRNIAVALIESIDRVAGTLED
jgi:hypothetical protein